MKKIRLFLTILFIFSFVFLYTMISNAAGWVDDGGGNWSYVDNDGFYAISTIKSSGDEKYYLDEYGIMVRDYLLEDYNESIYYFDDSGKMVKNTWVAVEPTQVSNGMDNPPTIYLYYFGNNGKAYQAKTGNLVRKTIDGKKYLFNENGQMLSGWINEEGERWDEYEMEMDPFDGYCYYAGDETDGVLREGWTSYEDGSVQDKYYLKTTLWFYFRSNDNKKIQSDNENELKTKTINGKSYAFDDKGVMVVGWDSDLLDVNNEDASVRSKKYFVEEGNDMGRNTKKEWFFAVPSMKQNLDDHDQETDRWFYALGSGEVAKGVMKKINGDFYVFDKGGIMKSGLCVIDKGTRAYIDSIDAERTDGKDFIISRHYISVDKTSNAQEFEIFDDSTQVLYFFRDDEIEDKSNFGKRKVGNAIVAFGDDDYQFTGQSSGEYEGLKRKRYYQAGLLLEPDPTVNMGVVLVGYSNNPTGESIDHRLQYYNSTNPWANPDTNHDNVKSDYIVNEDPKKCYDDYGVVPAFMAVNGKGSRFDKSHKVKKDKNGRYWLIGETGLLVNVYEVPIKYSKKDGWLFQSEILDSRAKVTTQWIKFGTLDEYGKTCKYSRTEPGDYALRLDDTYCLNFRFAD